MIKYILTSFVALMISGIIPVANAQEQAIIEMKIDKNYVFGGNGPSFEVVATKPGIKLKVDFGNGELITTEEISTGDKGTDIEGNLGDSYTIKIYGLPTDIKKFSCVSCNITEIDISKNTELEIFQCWHSKALKSLNVSSNVKLKTLDVVNTSISSLNLSKNKNLEKLRWQFNDKLTVLDLRENRKLKDIDCARNTFLSNLLLCKGKVYEKINCSLNTFKFSTLPIEVLSATSSSYNLQFVNHIALSYGIGDEIDLSSESTVHGVKTNYTWKTKSGKVLEENKDYTLTNGVTKFKVAQNEQVRCEMENKKFPKFTLKTSFTKIGGKQDPIVTMTKEQTRNGSFSFSVKGTKDNINIDVDFGDGKLTYKTIGTTKTAITGILKGSTVKIYGSSGDIASLECNNLSLTSLNVENSEALNELHCFSNKISSLNLSNNTQLKVLECQNNSLTFSSIDLGEASPSTFTYSPQNVIAKEPIVKVKDSSVDLSDQIINGTTTTFTWKTELEDQLKVNEDYSINNGVTIFLKPQSKKVYCEISNNKFPDLKLKTNLINVTVSTDINTGDKESKPSIYAVGKSIFVKACKGGHLTVYTLSGKAIVKIAIKEGLTEVPVSLVGLYIASYAENGQVYTQKIVVK